MGSKFLKWLKYILIPNLDELIITLQSIKSSRTTENGIFDLVIIETIKIDKDDKKFAFRILIKSQILVYLYMPLYREEIKKQTIFINK